MGESCVMCGSSLPPSRRHAYQLEVEARAVRAALNAGGTRVKELELLGQSLLTTTGLNRMSDGELMLDYGKLGLDVVKRFRRALAGKESDG